MCITFKDRVQRPIESIETPTHPVDLLPNELVTVPLARLDANEIEPDSRLADRGIAALAADIRTTRRVVPIVVVARGDRWTTIDGHRRVEASLVCGIQALDAVVVDEDEDDGVLFLRLNRSAKYMGAAQLFTAWAKRATSKARARFLQEIHGPTQDNIQKMIEIFGEGECVRLAIPHDPNAVPLSPHIQKWINMVASILRTYDLLDKHEGVTLRAVGDWMIAHKQSGVINRLVRNARVDPKDAINRPIAKKLWTAVSENRPYMRKAKRGRPAKGRGVKK